MISGEDKERRGGILGIEDRAWFPGPFPLIRPSDHVKEVLNYNRSCPKKNKLIYPEWRKCG